jgi:23S rRNA (guanosine2251-2'-O)-methyltransferase
MLELEDLLDRAPPPALLVLADGIEDPRNLGAVIRSAAAAGAGGVILPERRSAQPGPTVAKSSAGAMQKIPLARTKNVQRALEALSDAGIWSVGLEAGAPDLWSVDLARPVCILVGGEGRGLSRLARERCDALAGIPLARGVASLNASVAASLALFEAVRQRAAR